MRLTRESGKVETACRLFSFDVMSASLKNRRNTPWTLAKLKQLGKKPDSVLARRLGRTIKEVVAERERRRIQLRTPPRRWTAREIKLLGTLADSELARRLRRPYSTVRARRNLLKIPALTRSSR